MSFITQIHLNQATIYRLYYYFANQIQILTSCLHYLGVKGAAENLNYRRFRCFKMFPLQKCMSKPIKKPFWEKIITWEEAVEIVWEQASKHDFVILNDFSVESICEDRCKYLGYPFCAVQHFDVSSDRYEFLLKYFVYSRNYSKS